MTMSELQTTDRLRECPNIAQSPEGFDGEQFKCAVCGYYRFIEGRYYRWTHRPEQPSDPACELVTQ